MKFISFLSRGMKTSRKTNFAFSAWIITRRFIPVSYLVKVSSWRALQGSFILFEIWPLCSVLERLQCTVCNVNMVGRENKRTNNAGNNIPTLRINAAASYKSRVKIELLLLKRAGLLFDWVVWLIKSESLFFNLSKKKKNISLARYGTWTHDPQIKSLMLYRLS